MQLVTYVHDSPPWKIADHAVHIPAAGSSQFGGTLFSRQRSSCWTALSRTSWQISPTRSARCGATTPSAVAEIGWCQRAGGSASEPRKHIVDVGLELVETVAGVVRLLRGSCAAS